MTRKDYIKAAATIRNCANGYSSVIARQVLCRDLAGQMADWFASDNPRFDRQCFLAACQPETN